MTNDEKSKILLSLKASMEYNPIRNIPIKSPYTGSLFGIQFSKFASIMAVALIIVLGSGASGVAANSLPGDLLYPIKININEKIELALSSPKTKIKVQEKLLSHRLDEVVALSVRGNLSEKSVAVVEIGLTKHTDILNKEIIKLRDEKKEDLAIEISENINTSFKAHESIYTSNPSIKNTDELLNARLQSTFVKNSSKAFALREEFYNKKDTKFVDKKDDKREKTATKPDLSDDTKTVVTATTPEPRDEPEQTKEVEKETIPIDTIDEPKDDTLDTEIDPRRR